MSYVAQCNYGMRGTTWPNKMTLGIRNNFILICNLNKKTYTTKIKKIKIINKKKHYSIVASK
jgi:hypothetical protein